MVLLCPKRLLRVINLITILCMTICHGSFPSGSNSVVFYWGQGSNSQQKNLLSYCTESTDVIILAFLHVFNLAGLPSVNFADACDTYFSGTSLLSCPQIGQEIQSCQAKGKKVLLSLGGAIGSYGFKNDAEGVTFANTLWNMFGRGSSKTRPFGNNTFIDGFDLDIEGGTSTGYVAFVNQLRKLFATDSSKTYYITAAPQCPFPDVILGAVINGASFDAVHVQFYNNYCSVTGSNFNFATWDNWARTVSPNKNVKVFLAIPGSASAAGNGYVSFARLSEMVKSVSSYPSFGGVTVWDAAHAFTNLDASPNYGDALGTLVHGLTNSGTTTTLASPASSQTTITTTRTSTLAPPTLPSVSTGQCEDIGTVCSTHGQYRCTPNGSYAVCNFNQWITSPCPEGTTCFGTADGSSIYCGYGDTPPCAGTDSHQPAINAPGQLSAELSINNVSGQTFQGLINVRCLGTQRLGDLTFHMTMMPNMSITDTPDGSVDHTNQTFHMHVRNRSNKTMAVRVLFDGQLAHASHVVVAPNLKYVPQNSQ